MTPRKKVGTPKKVSTPKRVITPKKVMKQQSKPEKRFFDQYIWHHKVHEHLGEKLRYFLLKVSPYDEDKLSNSLERLVKDNHISGLRAYRVFGRNDMMVRAWMHEETFEQMALLFHKYIVEGEIRLNATESDFVTSVEYRWYWKETPPNVPALTKNSELVVKLETDPDHDLVTRIESGKEEDKEIFYRYEKAGLIVPKQATANTITFFICVKVPDNGINIEERKRLVDAIKKKISESNLYIYPEIDSAFGNICKLIIRARVRAHDYFAIGDLIRWLTKESHVAGTETYLSLTGSPLYGCTGLSLATFDARQQIDPLVRIIFDDPNFPSGPHPPRKWGKIAREVAEFLKEKGLTDPPRGLKKFLQDYLLAALRKESCLPTLQIFPDLEKHLRRRHKEYIRELGLNVEEVYKAAEITNQKHIMLENLLRIYYRAAKMAARPVHIPGNWEPFLEVRNKTMHGVDHYWRVGANNMITYWPKVQLLCKEIESVCQSLDRHPPQPFAD